MLKIDQYTIELSIAIPAKKSIGRNTTYISFSHKSIKSQNSFRHSSIDVCCVVVSFSCACAIFPIIVDGANAANHKPITARYPSNFLRIFIEFWKRYKSIQLYSQSLGNTKKIRFFCVVALYFLLKFI